MRSRMYVVALALVGAAGSCFFQQAGTPQPTPQGGTTVVTPAGGGEQAARQVRIVNETGQQVCYLYVSGAGESWGDDRLGNATMPPGGEVTLALGGYAAWDLKAEDCGHNVLVDVRGQPVPADGVWHVVAGEGGAAAGGGTAGGTGGTTPQPQAGCGEAPAPPIQVQVVNGTGREITYLYVSHADTPDWGEDRLGSSTLAAGASVTVTLDQAVAAWDVKGLADDNETIITRMFGFCAQPGATWEVRAEVQEPRSVHVPSGGGEVSGGGGGGGGGGGASRYAIAAAYFHKVGGGGSRCFAIEDDDLQAFCEGRCFAIEDDDLEAFCDGRCFAIEDDDLEALCDGRCFVIEDDDLQAFCDDRCFVIEDDDAQALCDGRCFVVEDDDLQAFCER